VDRFQFAQFLRTRREALRPGDVGLPPGGLRRTPGLRREEVAALAGIKSDFYERLELGRVMQVAPEVVADLAKALRLHREAFVRLCRLAGFHGAVAGERYVEPGTLALLDALVDVPAWVLDDAMTVVAQNALSSAFHRVSVGQPGWRSNLVWQWFMIDSPKQLVPPHDRAVLSRALVTELRAAAAWRGEGTTPGRLVADLKETSPEFARHWEQAAVTRFEPIRFSCTHRVGLLELNLEMMVSPATGHRLLLLRPDIGTGTSVRLGRLKPDRPAEPAGEAMASRYKGPGE